MENAWIQHLSRAGVSAARAALDEIEAYVRDYPEQAFDIIRIGERQKKALAVDRSAERIFQKTLGTYHKKLFDGVVVLGEETLDDEKLDLSNAPDDRVYALVDAVDGTDLLERGIDNWCAAGVFFHPKGNEGPEILGAFVALPSKAIYYSALNDDVVWAQASSRGNPRAVSGPCTNKNLMEASVCFYGQKVGNLTALFPSASDFSVPDQSLFGQILALDGEKKHRRLAKKEAGISPSVEDEPVPFRIYNLAGIPMMVKLIDHKIKAARHVDVIFDITGQKPHDVVPGAYLAMKAGATVRQFVVKESTLDGEKDIVAEEMTYNSLARVLLKPSARSSDLRYMITATKELADQIEPWLLSLVKQQLERKPHVPTST